MERMMAATKVGGGGGRSESPWRHTIWQRRRPESMTVMPERMAWMRSAVRMEMEEGDKHLMWGPWFGHPVLIGQIWPSRELVWPAEWPRPFVWEGHWSLFLSIVAKFWLE